MSYQCSICKSPINEKVYQYSRDLFGRALCVDCQQKANSVQDTAAKAKATPQAIKLADALTRRGIRNNLEVHDGVKQVDIAIPWARIYIELEFRQPPFDPKQLRADLAMEVCFQDEEIRTIKVLNTQVDQNVEAVADAIAKEARRRAREDWDKDDDYDYEEDDVCENLID